MIKLKMLFENLKSKDKIHIIITCILLVIGFVMIFNSIKILKDENLKSINSNFKDAKLEYKNLNKEFDNLSKEITKYQKSIEDKNNDIESLNSKLKKYGDIENLQEIIDSSKTLSNLYLYLPEENYDRDVVVVLDKDNKIRKLIEDLSPFGIVQVLLNYGSDETNKKENMKYFDIVFDVNKYVRNNLIQDMINTQNKMLSLGGKVDILETIVNDYGIGALKNLNSDLKSEYDEVINDLYILKTDFEAAIELYTITLYNSEANNTYVEDLQAQYFNLVEFLDTVTPNISEDIIKEKQISFLNLERDIIDRGAAIYLTSPKVTSGGWVNVDKSDRRGNIYYTYMKDELDRKKLGRYNFLDDIGKMRYLKLLEATENKGEAILYNNYYNYGRNVFYVETGNKDEYAYVYDNKIIKSSGDKQWENIVDRSRWLYDNVGHNWFADEYWAKERYTN